MTWPAVTHSHESEHHSPQRLDVALLHALAKCSDALDGVGASTILIETAELVLIQTAARVIPSVRMCDMARVSSSFMGGKGASCTLDFTQVGHLGQRLRQLHATLDSKPIARNAVQRGEQVCALPNMASG